MPYKKYFEGYCFLYYKFLQLKRERSLFYQISYRKVQKSSMITLMFNLKFKLLWKYFTNRPFKLSPSPSFIAQISSVKHFVQWKCLALILSEEIVFNFVNSVRPSGPSYLFVPFNYLKQYKYAFLGVFTHTLISLSSLVLITELNKKCSL